MTKRVSTSSSADAPFPSAEPYAPLLSAAGLAPGTAPPQPIYLQLQSALLAAGIIKHRHELAVVRRRKRAA